MSYVEWTIAGIALTGPAFSLLDRLTKRHTIKARRIAQAKKRAIKAHVLGMEVSHLWMTKENALAYLQLQGYTRKSALREYDKRIMGAKALRNERGPSTSEAAWSDPLDDSLEGL